jgi:ATP-dependent Clp protease protease subunit
MNGAGKSDELYATLAGRIDDALMQRLFDRMSAAVSGGVRSLHLMVQSTGGIICNGIAMYNYLRNLPIELTFYNAGTVQSIAVIVFLAAKRRRASGTATFMIHKATFHPGMSATSAQLYAATRSLDVDDARIESILKAHIAMPDDKWSLHRMADLFITAQEAAEFGLIDEVHDFAPPSGAALINI